MTKRQRMNYKDQDWQRDKVGGGGLHEVRSLD